MNRVLDIRPILLVMINIVMIFILYTINDFLSAYGIYIIVPVLFLFVPAVYLKIPAALFVISITALFAESVVPVRGFSFVLIWLLAALAIRTQRFRFRRMKFMEIFALLAIVNTFMVFLYGIFFFSGSFSFFSYAFKVFCDAFFSVLFLLYSAFYVLSFHHSLFKMLGLELDLERDVL